jgi:hypothetical protein
MGTMFNNVKNVLNNVPKNSTLCTKDCKKLAEDINKNLCNVMFYDHEMEDIVLQIINTFISSYNTFIDINNYCNKNKSVKYYFDLASQKNAEENMGGSWSYAFETMLEYMVDEIESMRSRLPEYKEAIKILDELGTDMVRKVLYHSKELEDIIK